MDDNISTSTAGIPIPAPRSSGGNTSKSHDGGGPIAAPALRQIDVGVAKHSMWVVSVSYVVAVLINRDAQLADLREDRASVFGKYVARQQDCGKLSVRTPLTLHQREKTL